MHGCTWTAWDKKMAGSCLLLFLTFCFVCLIRKWTGVTRWRALHANSTSAGCAWVLSAKSTHTVTLTIFIHPAITGTLMFCLLLHIKGLFVHTVTVFSCLLQTLPRRRCGWRRFLEWRGGLKPVECLRAVRVIWMHFISHVIITFSGTLATPEFAYNRMLKYFCHWFEYGQAKGQRNVLYLDPWN